MKQKIVLGTVQFGLNYGVNNTNGKPSYKNVKLILDYAFSNNILILDTAEAYGDSQEIIGKYIKETANKFNIITKYSSSRKDLPNSIYQRIKKNISTLGVDYIHGYLFHSFSDYEKYFNLFKEEFIKLKNEGLLKKIGVSIYDNEEMERVMENDLIDIIQLPFNLFDNKNKRGKLLQKAKVKNIEIHTRSIFLQGLFFKNINELKGNIQEFKPYLHKINEISSNNNLKINELALKYGVNQENIDYVLIGVDNVNQLKENIDTLNKKGENEEKIFNEINSINILNNELLNPSKWKI